MLLSLLAGEFACMTLDCITGLSGENCLMTVGELPIIGFTWLPPTGGNLLLWEYGGG